MVAFGSSGKTPSRILKGVCHGVGGLVVGKKGVPSRFAFHGVPT